MQSMTPKNRLRKNVIIGGLPRSGTTLISAVLDAQDSISVYPEEISLHKDFRYSTLIKGSHGFDLLLYRLIGFSSILSAYVDEFIDLLPSHQELSVESVFRSLLDWWAAKNGGDIWVYKHPGSIYASEKALELWDDSVLIYMVRDIRDVIVSTRSKEWASRSSVRIARKWKKYLTIVNRLSQDYPGRVMILRYEDLVLDPQRALEKIFIILGFDPKNICVSIGSYSNFSGHNSQFEDIQGSTFSKAGIGRHIGRLEPNEIETVNIIAGNEMNHLDYLKENKTERVSGVYSLISFQVATEVIVWELYDFAASLIQHSGFQYELANLARKLLPNQS